MAFKKSMNFVVGITLTVYGVILLLESLGLIRLERRWWYIVVLLVVGVLAVIGRGTRKHVMGWVCLVFGGLLLLMMMGIFSISGLWNYAPAVTWIALGLFLLG